MESIEVRPIADAEIKEWMDASSSSFGGHRSEDEFESWLARMALERTLGIFEDGRIVGTTTSFGVDMKVPGSTLPVGCVSSVAVMPTHRRRGMLTRMMAYQLRDFHEREEPLSALYASEGLIYGRFGYGIGTQSDAWTVRQHAPLTYRSEPSGRVHFITPEDAWTAFPLVFDRVWQRRQGMMSRDERRWHRRLDEKERSYFHAVYWVGDAPDGYVLYRIGHGDAAVHVYELIAATDEAYAALWEFCLGVDTMRHTKVIGPITDLEPQECGRPTDDPLPWMLADPRDLTRRPTDGIWLRLVDVRSALANRTYAADGRLVIEVKDSFCDWNEGRWAIEGGPEGARCEKTGAKPDLVMTTSALASLYLGGLKLRTLADAGRIEARTAKAVATADGMFATELQPWCADHF